jgi:hypothetical protein
MKRKTGNSKGELNFALELIDGKSSLLSVMGRQGK